MSSATSSSTASSATATASSGNISSGLKVVGVILAVVSGVLIGSSFVFKKKGLLRSQTKNGGELGEGVAYLKSWMWWIGMSMMILGEICNFVAYAFVEAVVVTPLGALSVVICAILSSIFLNEKLSFFGWLGCVLCIVGSVIIALNGPEQATVGEIDNFRKLFLAPGFLVWGGLLILASLIIIFYFGPRYGKQSMLWFIFVCSMIGGLSVSCTTGLGAAIVTSFQGNNQFKHWFIYFLLGFVAVTLVTEVIFLNKALALFNTAMVTPTYYVIFTFFTLVTTVILFQGLNSSVVQILTIVCGFLTICAGITILQMSKVDPTQLNKLDRRSTLLLQAARRDTELAEKSITVAEEPGVDALRGSFGAFGSIVRARSARRLSMNKSRGDSIVRSRIGSGMHPEEGLYSPKGIGAQLPGIGTSLQRHQLYDPPVPSSSQSNAGDTASWKTFEESNKTPHPRTPTIKFETQDVAHYYPRPGSKGSSLHEMRKHRERVESGPLPPLPLGSPVNPSRTMSPVPDGPLTPRARQHGPYTAPASSANFLSQQTTYRDPYETSVPMSALGLKTPNTATPVIEEVSEESVPSPVESPSKHRKGKRHYPRSDSVEDREESVGLVGRGSELFSSSSDSVDSTDEINGGIRLVTNSRI